MIERTYGGANEGLTLVARLREEVADLRVSGELDLSTSQLLDVAVDDSLTAGATSVHLDLSEVTFVDSSGLAALLRTQRACDAAAVTFDIAAMSSRVARIVELAGVAELLPPA